MDMSSLLGRVRPRSNSKAVTARAPGGKVPGFVTLADFQAPEPPPAAANPVTPTPAQLKRPAQKPKVEASKHGDETLPAYSEYPLSLAACVEKKPDADMLETARLTDREA